MALLLFLIISTVGFSVEGNTLPICESGRTYLQGYYPSDCPIRNYLPSTFNLSVEIVKTELEEFCENRADAHRVCSLSIYNTCSDELKTNITRWYKEHKDEFCDGSNIRQEVKDLIPAYASLRSPQGCMHNLLGVNSRISNDLEECSYASGSFTPINDTSIYFYLNHANRFHSSLYRCYLSIAYRQLHCSDNELKALVFEVNYYARPGLILAISVEDIKKRQTPRYGPRSTVMAFGDPHLKVYKRNKFIACTAVGERVYLLNSYLRITATNTFLPGSNVATIITKLSITFINNRVTIATYNASDSKLPSTFTNDKDSATDGDETVSITTNENIATIINEKSGIIIYIRRYKHTYPMLLVRMADNVLDTSIGLLIDGCSDVFDISTARRKRSSDECDAVCNGVDEEYKDPCYFDCEVTGDKMLASVTSDIKNYQQQAESTDAELSDGSGAGAVKAQYYITIITILLTFIK